MNLSNMTSVENKILGMNNIVSRLCWIVLCFALKNKKLSKRKWVNSLLRRQEAINVADLFAEQSMQHLVGHASQSARSQWLM